STYSVRIETDGNLMEYIEVRVNGDRLQIKVRNNFNLDPTKGINVYVSAPVYNGISASGACDVSSENKLITSEVFDIDVSGASNITLDLKAPTIEGQMSGACKVNLKGETKDFKIDGSGSSEIRCFELMAENVDVGISGAGHADVFASVSLKADLSGAGSIKYKGNPSVSQNVSGAGSVSKAD
ncbi:MAG: head GIN domain-containing protein, partial [Chitinophagaceae bacterium]